MQFSTAHQAYYDRDRDAGHGSSASPLVRTVSAYVQEHLTENITADGIAQLLYLSPNRYLKVTVFHAGKCANIFLHVFLNGLVFHHTTF